MPARPRIRRGLAWMPSSFARVCCATEYPIAPGAGPVGITSGPDGAIYFAENVANRIGRMELTGRLSAEYPIPTADSHPIQIAAGPGQTIWFTEQAANQLGMLRLRGHCS
jgi:virginiamycin B lyase